MKIYLDENICVRCGACVSESQCDGVTFKDGKIFIDDTKREDWAEIISVCPVGALKICAHKILVT